MLAKWRRGGAPSGISPHVNRVVTALLCSGAARLLRAPVRKATALPDAVAAEGSDAVATRVIERLDELDDLQPAWGEVGAGADSAMQGHEWPRSGAPASPTDDPLRVVVAGSGRQPGAIAPLVERRSPFPPLELLGADELDEPVDVVGSDPSAVRALAD